MLFRRPLLIHCLLTLSLCGMPLSAQTTFGDAPIEFVFPHILVDPGDGGQGFSFDSQLSFINTAGVPCDLRVEYNTGANQPLDFALLSNGAPVVGFQELTIDPFMSADLFLSPAGDDAFNGAAVVRTQTDACRGSIGGAVELLLKQDGVLLDDFSYEPPPIQGNNLCTQLNLNGGDTGLDFSAGVAFSGASVDGTFPDDAGLFLALKTDSGLEFDDIIFNGSKDAKLLNELFPGFNQGLLEVCPFGLGNDDVISVTAINLRIDPATSTFRFGSVAQQTAGEFCRNTDTVLCLQDGRFRVDVDFGGQTAQAVPQPDDSGLFFFFGPDNWELLVKVLDGCSTQSDSFWVFAAATTDVEYTVTVTDTGTGQTKNFFNPLNSPSPAIVDTNAFATCP